MSDDDNVTPITKPAKDPKKAALSKLAEGSAKEWAAKIETQVKRTVDAVKIATNEKKALAQIIEDWETAKAEYAEFIQEI